MNMIWFCLLICLTCVYPLKGQILCRVPSVKEKEGTNLTCYFPEDVSKSKKDVTVFHYKGTERPIPVVECMWAFGQLQCQTQAGYMFDQVATDTMTVQVPRVTANETGKYTCQITGYKPDDIKDCELSLSSGKTTCKLRSVEIRKDTRLTCYFPENIGKTKKNFFVYHFDENGNATVVIDCFWLKNALRCAVLSGYQYDAAVSDRFEVQLTQASQSATGSYRCEVVGAPHDQASLCSFRRTERNGNLSNSQNSALTAAVIVLACVVVVTLVAGAVIIFLVIRLKRKSKETQKSPESSSDSLIPASSKV